MSIFRRKSRTLRKPRPTTTRQQTRRPDNSAWATNAFNHIATIDHIGRTAVATLTVTSLSTDEGVERLSGLLKDVSHSGAKYFVLDMQNLEYMDSLCLGCLIKALNHASSHGGGIALVNCEGTMLDIFRTTHLNRRFPICQDVLSALAAVEKKA